MEHGPISEPPQLAIRLAGGYPFRQVERLIRDVDPLATLETPCRLHLDLGGLAFIGASGLAWLIAVVRRAEDFGLISGGSVVLPRSPLTRHYLMRMDFLTTLDLATIDDEPFDRHRAVGFRPCRRYRDEESCHSVVRELTEALTESIETDDVARFGIRICLDELAENVIFHADTNLGGFVIAQRLRRRPEFEIAIADLGIGIRRSLQKNPDFADIRDDVTAIARALQPRVSSTPERNGGFGLAVSKLLLAANGGTLVVRSGNGRVQTGAEEHEQHEPVALPGTLVALRARTDRPLNVQEAYRHLKDDFDARMRERGLLDED